MAYFIQPLRTPSLQLSHPCSAPLLLLGKVVIENKLEAVFNFLTVHYVVYLQFFPPFDSQILVFQNESCFQCL